MLPLLLVAAMQPPEVAPAPHPVTPLTKWGKNILAIEKKLEANPPKPGGVFFVGSSSIVMWDLKKSFPDAGYVNVGFGGSVIADSTFFASRIITPFKPATIIFYAGDNDIGAGRKPEQLAADFKAFVEAARAENPSCKVLFISVKPSLSRARLFEVQKKANALVKEYCEKGTGLVYVDIVPLMLGADGKPMPELFQKDGLHMTPKGYEIWAAAVSKLLK